MSELRQIEAEAIDTSRALTLAIGELRDASVRHARADDAYRCAHAKALLEAEGTVDSRKAQADLATSGERLEARISEGLKIAALEAVRSLRTQLSAWQSLMSAHRAEAEFVRTAPE